MDRKKITVYQKWTLLQPGFTYENNLVLQMVVLVTLQKK